MATSTQDRPPSPPSHAPKGEVLLSPTPESLLLEKQGVSVPAEPGIHPAFAWAMRIALAIAVIVLVLYLCRGIAYSLSESKPPHVPETDPPELTEGHFAFVRGSDAGAGEEAIGAHARDTAAEGAESAPQAAPPHGAPAKGSEAEEWAKEKQESRQALRDWLRKLEPRDEDRPAPRQSGVPEMHADAEGQESEEEVEEDADDRDVADGEVLVPTPGEPAAMDLGHLEPAEANADPGSAPSHERAPNVHLEKSPKESHDAAAPRPRITRFAESRTAQGTDDKPPLTDTQRAVGEIPDDELPWASSIDMVLALEAELKSTAPVSDPRILRSTLYHHLIDLSVRVGHTDNPRENLEAIRAFLTQPLGVVAVERDAYPLALLRPSTVLSGKRGSPAGVAQLLLVLADRLNPYLDLEPVFAGDLLGLRYGGENHRYTLVPAFPDRLYSDRDLVELAYGKAAPAAHPIRTLTRKQFWGFMLGEVGAALFSQGESERAAQFVERGLLLFAEQSRARIARARIFLERRDLAAAREEIDAAVSLEPRSTLARCARIEVLEMLGDASALEQDLRFLAQAGGNPHQALALAELLHRFSRAEEALDVLELLASQTNVPGEIRAASLHLREKINVAPWVKLLADVERPAADRFEALEKVRAIMLPEVDLGLLAAMGDDNLRLGRYAWQALRQRTGWDLPLEPAAWQKAFLRSGRDRAPAPDPAHPAAPAIP